MQCSGNTGQLLSRASHTFLDFMLHRWGQGHLHRHLGRHRGFCFRLLLLFLFFPLPVLLALCGDDL